MQTTVQNIAAIRKGSTRVMIGDDFDNLVDIGAIRNAEFESMVDNQEIEFDNVESLKKFTNGKKVKFNFDLCEINLSNLAVLDSGLITVTTQAGSLVSGAEQVIASPIVPNVFIPLANQNGNGSVPTINSVTGATDGALAANDGYALIQSNGVWGIIFSTVAASELTTLSQIVTVDYDYTPNASKKIEFAEFGNKSLKCMRIINTDENNKSFKIDIEDGTNFVPVSIDFASDTEAEVAVMPVEFMGYIVDVVDEQQTT